MPLVNISEEDLAFLQDLAREITTQDNAATAPPYFYVVRTKRELLAPAGYGTCNVFFDPGAEEPRFRKSLGEVKADLHSEGLEESELEARIEGVEEHGVHETFNHANVFFTRKGYEQHMNLNNHNYPGDAHPYICHAWRNPEIKMLLEIVKRVGAQDSK